MPSPANATAPTAIAPPSRAAPPSTPSPISPSVCGVCVCVGVCVVCGWVGVYDNIKQNFLHVYGCLSIIITVSLNKG